MIHSKPIGQVPISNKTFAKKLPYVYAVVFFCISILWTQLTNLAWDDDAVGRFFNTQDAGSNPLQFLDSWNRPLFVTIFYLPIKFFGRFGMSVTMSILTAVSGLLLYKGLERKNIPNAGLAVPFLLFQTFLFGISRDAMTEPLVSFFICTGIYFLYTGKYIWFALVGSLLPLARPEMLLLTVFWIVPLLQAKRYLGILLLGTGTFLWWLGWTMYSGNVMAFFGEVFKTGGSSNRYGHTEVSHYIGKYIYILGPVVFFYFVLGYLYSIKNIIKDYFILLQFTVGFFVYVAFASFLDLGQSSGPLRTLLTLSPFAAIIALYGYNHWCSLTIKGATLKKPDNRTGKTKGYSYPPKETAGLAFEKLKFLMFIIFIVVISADFFTDKLLLRQSYDPGTKDYTIFTFLCGGIFLAILPLFTKKRLSIITVLLLLVQLSFTLFYENPQSHTNSERSSLTEISSFMLSPSFKSTKILCNHPWFFWSTGYKRSDGTRFGHLDSAHLRAMAPGDVALWDPHYTTKFYGNIPLSMLYNDPSMAAFYYVADETSQTRAIAFLKLYSDPAKNNLFFETLAKEHKADNRVYYMKGCFECQSLKAFPKAAESFSETIKLNPANGQAYLQRAVTYLNMGDREKACGDLHMAASMGLVDADLLIRQYCLNPGPVMPTK